MKHDEKTAKVAKKDRKVSEMLPGSYILFRKWRQLTRWTTLRRTTSTTTRSLVMT